MQKYDHKKIEKKWQDTWEKTQAFKTEEDSTKPKQYILDMFPYPSGAGLHVGHVEGYTATDIYSRYKRASGFNVLHPMGWDAFGLPAENYAIKTGTPPQRTTDESIDNFRAQIKNLGLSYDWSREFGTHNPEYYKWTQWLFAKFFEKGLVYKKKALVNWDPIDQTVLANEQVLPDGTAERSGAKVEKKELEQWFYKITDYADELIAGLDTVDWPESTKINQRNWVGRSEGAEITFKLNFKKRPEYNNTGNTGPVMVDVFTTRPDTLFGATYLVLAPENLLVSSIFIDDQHDALENKEEVKAYVEAAKKKSDIERGALGKEKTGVEIKGVKAINPATKEEIPVYIADYVLGGYGTGAIMAVPAHDERDFEFAQKFDLPIQAVIEKKKYCIFDFDGVVGNTFEIAARAQVAMGHMPSLEAAREDVKNYARNKPNHTRDHTLTPEQLQAEYDWTEKFGKEMSKSDLPLFDEFIREILKIPNCEIAIVSTGSEVYVKPAIERSTLKPTHIMGWESSHSKEEKIEKICKEWNIKLEEAYYFTDTKADVYELQFFLDLKKIIGCAWGFLGKEELEEVLPRDQILENFSDVHRVFSQFVYTGEGTLSNSAQFNGLLSTEAKKKITEFVGGKITKTYRLRDWLISRQRYWGAPIPIVYDPDGKAHAVPDEHLPWLLPTDVEYLPKGTSPLGTSKELFERTERIFGKGWKPEIDTMDTFACSSWYFFRFADPHNDKEFASKEAMQKWLPVDLYVGGAEHTVLHLLYARFYTKALRDMGYLSFDEPFLKLRHPGIILAEDSRKMSKRWGNVINPDDMVERFGADSVRLYEMFMGPLEAMKPWNTNNVMGVRRFLERVWAMQEKVADVALDGETETLLHQTIEKVTKDIETLKMNTAISALMILSNHLQDLQEIPKAVYGPFLKLLNPFAPHMTSEIAALAGYPDGAINSWPVLDSSKINKKVTLVAVQVNGKVRATIELSPNATESEALTAARANENVAKWLTGGQERRAVYIAGKIINFVVG